MKGFGKIAAGVFLATALTTSLAVTNTAHASAKGRRNTAIALGAVAVHQLLNGKTSNALVAGAATAAAYGRYKNSKDNEDRYDRRRRGSNDRDWYDRATGQNRDRDNGNYRRTSDTDRYDRNRVSYRTDRDAKDCDNDRRDGSRSTRYDSDRRSDSHRRYEAHRRDSRSNGDRYSRR